MTPSVKVFWTPKLGNSAEEYEDASAHATPERRFAVADGATESSFADRWARSLVETFVARPPLTPPDCVPLPEWVAPLQQAWRAGVPWDTLPWFAEEKARAGAFAAFLGVYFLGGQSPPPRPSLWRRLWGQRAPERPGIRWHALAIGDACLFQVREERLLRAFPLEQAAAFSPRPLLLSSEPGRNQGVWPAVQLADGDCRDGDLFLLGTDALAKWFLQTHEAGGRPWQTLAAVETQADFAALVDKLRQARSLKNDDTTVLFFQWRGGASGPGAGTHSPI